MWLNIEAVMALPDLVPVSVVSLTDSTYTATLHWQREKATWAGAVMVAQTNWSYLHKH